jgi:Zn-dependent protease with chaperone function
MSAFNTTSYRYPNERLILAATLILVLLVIIFTSAATFCLSFIFVFGVVFLASASVKAHHRELLNKAYLVTPANEPDLAEVVQQAVLRLQVESVQVFVVKAREVNAYTFGLDNPKAVVLYSPLFQLMDRHELQFIIGHELGHVKLGHTELNSLVGGIAGIPASISGALILNLALLSWTRACEYSADRAGLLACGDIRKAITALVKLEARSGDQQALQQALARLDAQDDDPAHLLNEILMTHPLIIKRIDKLRDFARSPAYKKLQERVNQNLLS